MVDQRLGEVQKSREVQRSGRRDAFRASLVGYTNAGKSSILRAIGNAPEVFVEDRLFATLDPLTREIDLGENSNVLVTDTVGFIRKLPHNLVASFRATLEEINEADLLLHVLDVGHPHAQQQFDSVHKVLEEIGAKGKPELLLLNKIDTPHGEEAVPFWRTGMRARSPRPVVEAPGRVAGCLFRRLEAARSGERSPTAARASCE